MIPEDNSLESIKTREKIIRDFYREWKEQNPLYYRNSKRITRKGIRIGCL